MIQNNLMSAINPALTGTAAVGPAPKAATPFEATASFATFLKNALDSVAAQETNVHTLNDQFMIGQADVNDVMIASSKAELSLELTSQIRNKVIEAYQEIMRITM